MPEASTNLPVNKDKPAGKQVDRPWTGFDSLRQEIDRLFDDFHPLSFKLPFARAGGGLLADVAWPVAPAIDMTEKGDHYEITAELPGVDEKNVEVKVAGGVLTIKGEKTDDKTEEKKDYHLSERRYGAFQRSFRLPDGVDADRIDAKFSKGLLSVSLPKTADAVQNEKKIEIKAG